MNTPLKKRGCQSFKIVPTLALTVTIKSVKVGGMSGSKNMLITKSTANKGYI